MNKLTSIYICSIFCLLVFFGGCVNKDRLTARTEMLHVLLWLTGNPERKPPSTFSHIEIKYSGYKKVVVAYADTVDIYALKFALTPCFTSLHSLDDKVQGPTQGVATGTLTLYRNNFSFEAQIRTEDNNLTLEYAIPGDNGGHAVNTLVGVVPKFKNWLLSREK